ncbi:hypothetical protein J4Q44_G00217390 [Coregonus suidteri]|uniref:Uncharacterized protein n=1 Tax=Coregonus suidteri TaxID=861788 RepID=A0AAN8LDX2_9TELE
MTRVVLDSCQETEWKWQIPELIPDQLDRTYYKFTHTSLQHVSASYYIHMSQMIISLSFTPSEGGSSVSSPAQSSDHRPLDSASLNRQVANRISACLADISVWMSDHHLKLNLCKTELLFLPGKDCPLHDLAFTVDNSIVSSSQSAKNIGVTLDNTSKR